MGVFESELVLFGLNLEDFKEERFLKEKTFGETFRDVRKSGDI